MSFDLETALNTNIAEPIDSVTVEHFLSQPPFVKADGVANARDLGGDPRTAPLRKGYIFRSGLLEGITEQGKQDLVDLGIKKIFDLRSAREIDVGPDPEIGGIEVVTVAKGINVSPMDAAKYSTVRGKDCELLLY
jgi:protein tyrosine/serine phosphatase